jgi:cell wall assembly regulator SMI1
LTRRFYIVGMDETWERIERWLRQHAPEAFDALRPPASPEEIAGLERLIGTALPDDYRASLRRHDGQKAVDHLFDVWELSPIKSVASHWTNMCEVERQLKQELSGAVRVRVTGPVRPVRWSDLWVPFADSGMGYKLCLDLDPAPGGNRGQVVEFRHDVSERVVHAPSFADWLSREADDFEGGRYKIDEIGWPVRPRA